MANLVFSIGAALASAVVSVLAAAKGATAVAVIWGALSVGFVLRAILGRRRRRP